MNHVHRCAACDPDLAARVIPNPADHITRADGLYSNAVDVYQGDAKLLRCFSARPGAWAVQAAELTAGMHPCPCGGIVPFAETTGGLCLEVIEGDIRCTYRPTGQPVTQEEWAAWHEGSSDAPDPG